MIKPAIESHKYAEKDFKPFIDYEDSEYVGDANYDRFESYKYSERIIENSRNIGIFTALIATLYAFLAIWGIASVKKTVIKACVAFFFILPAVIPVIAYVLFTKKFFMTDGIIEGSRTYVQFVVSIIPGLRLGALFALGGLFIKEKPFDAALKLALVCLGVGLATMFSSDFDYIYLVQSPASYGALEVFDTYVYQMGLQSSSFSYGCAVDMIRASYQMLPAVIGAALAAFMFWDKPWTKRELSAPPVSGFSAAPLVLLVIILVTLVGGELWQIAAGKEKIMEMFANATENGRVLAFDIAKMTVLISLLMALAVYNFKYVGAAVCILLLAFGNQLISSFLMVKYDGLMNTYEGVVSFSKYQMVPVLALIAAFAMKRRKSVLPVVGILIAMLGIMFAWFWGNLKGPLIFLNDETKYPISILMRQISLQAVMEDVNGSGFGIQRTVSWGYILTPVIVSAVTVIGAAFADKGVMRLKEKYFGGNKENNKQWIEPSPIMENSQVTDEKQYNPKQWETVGAAVESTNEEPDGNIVRDNGVNNL